MVVRSWLGLVLSFLLVGCPAREDPEPTAAIRVTVPDAAQPLLLDFGEVSPPDSVDGTILIASIGDRALQLQDLLLTDARFELPDLGVPPLLEPGDELEVLVRYTPIGDESLDEELRILSNDVEQTEVLVGLLAEGIAPALVLDTEAIEFEGTRVGCSDRIDVLLTNVGRAPLLLSNPELVETVGSGDLTVLAHFFGGETLDPGAWDWISVVYAPSDAGMDAATVTVVSNDPARPTIDVNITGAGVEPPTQVDSFVAPDGGPVAADILWVIDDSAGMGLFQQALASAAGGFVERLEMLGVDYQIAVITTDPSTNGSIQGSIVTQSTPQPSDVFASYTTVGTGATVERALDQAYLALSSPNIDAGGVNDGFLRDAASLRVIFVSDEQEQSTLLNNGDTASYVSYFQFLSAFDVTLSSITGALTGCSGAYGSASSGSDFVAASVQSGGLWFSICDPDWAGMLSDLADACVFIPDSFMLTEQAAPDSIEVRVSPDGVNFTPLLVGWTYNAASWKVVFEPGAMPDAGDIVEVEYRVVSCGS